MLAGCLRRRSSLASSSGARRRRWDRAPGRAGGLALTQVALQPSGLFAIPLALGSRCLPFAPTAFTKTSPPPAASGGLGQACKNANRRDERWREQCHSKNRRRLVQDSLNGFIKELKLVLGLQPAHFDAVAQDVDAVARGEAQAEPVRFLKKPRPSRAVHPSYRGR